MLARNSSWGAPSRSRGCQCVRSSVFAQRAPRRAASPEPTSMRWRMSAGCGRNCATRARDVSPWLGAFVHDASSQEQLNLRSRSLDISGGFEARKAGYPDLRLESAAVLWHLPARNRCCWQRHWVSPISCSCSSFVGVGSATPGSSWCSLTIRRDWYTTLVAPRFAHSAARALSAWIVSCACKRTIRAKCCGRVKRRRCAAAEGGARPHRSRSPI